MYKCNRDGLDEINGGHSSGLSQSHELSGKYPESNEECYIWSKEGLFFVSELHNQLPKSSLESIYH